MTPPKMENPVTQGTTEDMTSSLGEQPDSFSGTRAKYKGKNVAEIDIIFVSDSFQKVGVVREMGSCVHHWVINQANIGRCRKCPEVRAFPRYPVKERFRGHRIFTANATTKGKRDDVDRHRYAQGAILLTNPGWVDIG